MFITLICSALLITPFFIWSGFDTRQPKLLLALVFSLGLSLYAFSKGYYKPYKNIWILLFLAFIPINFIFAPQIENRIASVQMSSWVLEAFLYILIFFLAHAALSSYQFSDDDKDKILKIMVRVGAVMSLYAAAQWFGFDQFFKGQQGGALQTCGTLGTPVLLSPFLAMIIPIALYFRKYIQSVLMLIVVFLCNSQVGCGAMIVSLIFLVGTKSKYLKFAMVSLFITLSLVLSIGFFTSSKIRSFVGEGTGTTRFPVWSQIIKDVKNPVVMKDGETERYGITGYGLGSFRYLFHARNSNAFFEAHNDYLELFYNTGLIGLGLFLLGLGTFVKQCLPLDRLKAHLLASFICVMVAAGGIFVLQQGAYIFYILVLTGLLTNKEVVNGEH